MLFARAVMITFDLWPALRLAVKEEWGGPESRDKADFLLNAVCDFFDQFLEQALRRQAMNNNGSHPNGSNSTQGSSNPLASVQPPDEDDLYDLVEGYMSDEFEVRLEDGSVDYVVGRLVSLWKVVFQQGPEAANAALAQLHEAQARLHGVQLSASRQEGPQEFQMDGSVDGSDDDSDGERDMHAETSARDEPMEMDTGRQAAEPIVDEDGFMTVTKGRRKR